MDPGGKVVDGLSAMLQAHFQFYCKKEKSLDNLDALVALRTCLFVSFPVEYLVDMMAKITPKLLKTRVTF